MFIKKCVGVSVGADGRALGRVCSAQVGVESQRDIQEPKGEKERTRTGPLGTVQISDSHTFEIVKQILFLACSWSRRVYIPNVDV